MFFQPLIKIDQNLCLLFFHIQYSKKYNQTFSKNGRDLIKILSGASTCPLNLVGSAGQGSCPFRDALGSAGQVRAVFGQSEFVENWAVFGQFF